MHCMMSSLICEWPEFVGQAWSCKNCQLTKARCIRGMAIVELPESNVRGEDHEEGPSSSPSKKRKIVLMHKKAEEALEQHYEEALSTLAKALTEGTE